MNSCNKIKKYLPEFIEEEHIKSCAICQKEKALLEKSWAVLEKWPAIKPSPDFRIRFWYRVKGIGRQRVIFPAPLVRRLVPALVSIFIIILGLSIFIKPRLEQINLVNEISDIEFYQNLEIIQNLDLLNDMEVFMEQDEYNG